MIKAIIFDCFGVLVGTGFHDTYLRAGGDPNKDKEFIQETLDRSNIGEITGEQMSQMMADKIGITVEQWNRAVKEAEQPNKPILQFIDKLRQTYKTAVLSNANVDTLQRKLTPEQLDLFDVVVVSAEIGLIKPDPEIYKFTAEKLGVMPDECVFMDDIAMYCEGAKAVGMKTIVYKDLASMKSELQSILARNTDN